MERRLLIGMRDSCLLGRGSPYTSYPLPLLCASLVCDRTPREVSVDVMFVVSNSNWTLEAEARGERCPPLLVVSPVGLFRLAQ